MYINSLLVEARQEYSPELLDAKTAAYQLLAVALFWVYSQIPTLWVYLKLLFSIPPEWPLRAVPLVNGYSAYSAENESKSSFDVFIVKSHPYACLSGTSTVFFGPITFAVPLVVLQDLTIHILLNIIYLSHGLVSTERTLAGYYHSTTNPLAFAPSICRFEATFSQLENMASVYNKCTTHYMPLLTLRLLAAALSVYIVLGLMFLWT
ncbi:hypothetical protein L218DRAFT_1006473 [Marasmius fiardii PR-910]|nr:hypothetical protein L218DRAFT_1006473 [Marasmius fiardii PR-910]